MELACICPDLEKINTNYLSQLVIDSQADIIVFPEYLLELVDIPQLQTDKLIVWGSKKYNYFNIVYYQYLNVIHTSKKMKMTTWENELYEGKELTVFNFEGLKVAILVCFDVEFPDIASRLKKENIDLLIVPSATETKLGYERVSRCASARAIELGCVVVTAHLIGKSENDMIDVNVGNHNIYYPSQSQFESYESKTHLLQTSGEVIQKFHLPINEVRNQRQLYNETNPCLKD